MSTEQWVVDQATGINNWRRDVERRLERIEGLILELFDRLEEESDE